jgi:hypothetical protein
VLISGSSNGKNRPTNLVSTLGTTVSEFSDSIRTVTDACVQLPEPCATIGAMTHSFIKALECQPHTTYGHLLTSMKSIMRQGGACKLQGPVGGSIHKVANFSGVEVSNIFLLLSNNCPNDTSHYMFTYICNSVYVVNFAGASAVFFSDFQHRPRAVLHVEPYDSRRR